MKRILILAYLISLSIYGLSQRTAEFISFNQTNENSSTIYEIKVMLNDALSNDELSKIQTFVKGSENNFNVIVDGKNLAIRSTPDYTKGQLYASFFQSIGIESFIQRKDDEMIKLSVDDYLNKTNN